MSGRPRRPWNRPGPSSSSKTRSTRTFANRSSSARCTPGMRASWSMRFPEQTRSGQRRHAVDHCPGRAGAVRPEDDEHPRPVAHARQRPHPRGVHQHMKMGSAGAGPRRCRCRARLSRAQVKSVANVASPQDWMSPDVKVYQAYVEIDEPVEDLKLKPGLSAVCTIFTEMQGRTRPGRADPGGPQPAGEGRQAALLRDDAARPGGARSRTGHVRREIRRDQERPERRRRGRPEPARPAQRQGEEGHQGGRKGVPTGGKSGKGKRGGPVPADRKYTRGHPASG